MIMKALAMRALVKSAAVKAATTVKDPSTTLESRRRPLQSARMSPRPRAPSRTRGVHRVALFGHTHETRQIVSIFSIGITSRTPTVQPSPGERSRWKWMHWSDMLLVL